MTPQWLTTLATACCLVGLTSCALSSKQANEPNRQTATPRAESAHPTRLSRFQRCTGCEPVTPKTLAADLRRPVTLTAPTLAPPGPATVENTPPAPRLLPSCQTDRSEPRTVRVSYAPGSASAPSASLASLERELLTTPIRHVILRGSTSGAECTPANRRLIGARVQGVRQFIEQSAPQVLIAVAPPASCTDDSTPAASTRRNRDRLVEVRMYPARSTTQITTAGLSKELP